MKRFIVACGLLLALSNPVWAALREEATRLPVTVSEAGQSRTVTLEALIIRPDDDKRHPLAVLSHGAPRDPADRPGMSPQSLRAQAREFARRGWVAVIFMRRGYGASEGPYAESSGRCSAPNYVASGRISAEDIRGVIRVMKDKPYVDATRILAVGRSAGGLATMALTADPPPGLVAAINFAGGRGSQGPDEVCTPPRLVEAFATFGKSARIPTLWVYSENDHFFEPDLAKRFHAAYVGGGGKADFIAAPAFGEDGHNLFSERGAPIWTRHVDDFLADQKLTLVSRLLPLRDESKIQYPRGLSAAGKEAFLKYLDSNGHKAFVTSSSGAYGWRSGQKSTAEAIEAATDLCRKNSSQPCRPFMINDSPAK
jgi:dienelactone hydrolase